VATQLIRKSPSAIGQARVRLSPSPRVLLGAFAFLVALSFASLFAGIYTAHRDEDAARKRFADAQALAALPPASTDSIREDLAVVRNALATAEAAVPSSQPVLSADATTTLIVRRAQAAGLGVQAVAGVAAGQAKVGDNTFDTQGVRVTVDGTLGQIVAFLDAVGSAQPWLIPSLTTMTFNDASVTHTEIVFSTYTKVVPPTPAATPIGTKK
jgi:hypothetical protein